jgi:hypothetical protein
MENRLVVLDEPLDLPDGTPLTVNVSNDVDADTAGTERAEFLRALDEAADDEEAGRMDDALEFADRLLARP